MRQSWNLFNPAYSGILFTRFLHGHRSQANEPLQLALAFLVLPIVHSNDLREATPTVHMNMRNWTNQNPAVVLRLRAQINHFVGLTIQTLHLLEHYEIVRVTTDGEIWPLENEGRLIALPGIGREDEDRALHLGKWFGTVRQLTVISCWRL